MHVCGVGAKEKREVKVANWTLTSWLDGFNQIYTLALIIYLSNKFSS